MIYLGQIGRLIPLDCAAEETRTTTEKYTFKTTLEGKRKAQAIPFTRRTWGITAPAGTYTQAAPLADFASGAWGAGPFIFISERAQRGNILSPETAALEKSKIMGAGNAAAVPVLTHDGWAPTSMSVGASGYWLGAQERYPIILDRPLTVSVYAMGAACRIRVDFLDAAGGVLTNKHSSPVASPTSFQRISLSIPPGNYPQGAISARVYFYNLSAITRPAITYTAQVMPWEQGQGCYKAVVLDGAHTTLLALDNPQGQWQKHDYQIVEVG